MLARRYDSSGHLFMQLWHCGQLDSPGLQGGPCWQRSSGGLGSHDQQVRALHVYKSEVALFVSRVFKLSKHMKST